MVGVARFELATPAMSTQGIGKKRQFSVHYHGRRYGTCVEQTAKRRYFHRNYTGEVFPPGLKSKAPDPAATGSSADIAYQAGGHSIHTTASDSRQRRPILSLRFG